MDWDIKEIPVPLSTSRCFHAATVCNGKLHMHGGMKEYSCSGVPLNDMIVFNPDSLTLLPVSTKNQGPSRSHHTAAAISDTVICIVGGWDGKKRTSDVWLFDVVDETWTLCKSGAQSVPPSGLSSHTCTLTHGNEMIITGREGGVRMQRRFGSVFNLIVDPVKRSAVYKELPDHIASRSGHTCCLVVDKSGSRKTAASMVVIGGRDSTGADLLRVAATVTPCNPDLSNVLHKFISKTKDTAVPLKKAIRHHAATPAGDLCLIQGGEIFGQSRNNVIPDLRIHDSTATRWWQINIPQRHVSAMARMGHTLAWLKQRLYVIGGVHNQKGNPACTVVEIQPTSELVDCR